MISVDIDTVREELTDLFARMHHSMASTRQQRGHSKVTERSPYEGRARGGGWLRSAAP